jgi:hypothetical protein
VGSSPTVPIPISLEENIMKDAGMWVLVFLAAAASAAVGVTLWVLAMMFI